MIEKSSSQYRRKPPEMHQNELKATDTRGIETNAGAVVVSPTKLTSTRS